MGGRGGDGRGGVVVVVGEDEHTGRLDAVRVTAADGGGGAADVAEDVGEGGLYEGVGVDVGAAFGVVSRVELLDRKERQLG